MTTDDIPPVPMPVISFTIDFYDRPAVTVTDPDAAYRAALDVNARTVIRTVRHHGQDVSESRTPASLVRADRQNL